MKRILFFLLLVADLGPASLLAQDTEDIHGSVTAAYRFTDIKGRREKYNELFDLRSGFRVLDFSLIAFRSAVCAPAFALGESDAEAFAADPLLTLESGGRLHDMPEMLISQAQRLQTGGSNGEV